VEECTRETNGSANQTAEMEADLTYDEEGFHCHRKMSFSSWSTQGQSRKKTEKEMALNTCGRS